MNEKVEKPAEDRKRFEALRDQAQSLIMATVDGQAVPRSSYAPFVRASGAFYVYLSRLSEHTRELLQNPVVSVMLIEDEAEASQIFARTRVTYLCEVQTLERDEAGYDAVLELLTSRFGNVMKMLQILPDFVLFRLQPVSGRFVTGFGKAYQLKGEGMDGLAHIGPEDVNPTRSDADDEA